MPKMQVSKVLLAEDDFDDRMFFETFVTGRTDMLLLGAVGNGAELIETLHLRNTVHELPDIIILDQNMPRLNGLETLRLLKSKEEYTHIPVIIYSTYISDNLVESCLHSGASLVLSKPDGIDGYKAMLDKMITVVSIKDQSS